MLCQFILQTEKQVDGNSHSACLGIELITASREVHTRWLHCHPGQESVRFLNVWPRSEIAPRVRHPQGLCEGAIGAARERRRVVGLDSISKGTGEGGSRIPEAQAVFPAGPSTVVLGGMWTWD